VRAEDEGAASPPQSSKAHANDKPQNELRGDRAGDETAAARQTSASHSTEGREHSSSTDSQSARHHHSGTASEAEKQSEAEMAASGAETASGVSHARAFAVAPQTTDLSVSGAPLGSTNAAQAAVAAPPLAENSAMPTPHASSKPAAISTVEAAEPVATAQLRTSASGAELRVSVHLSELGKVEVRAVSAHNVTTAHLTASGHGALQALDSERGGLEQALKSRNVLLGSLEAETRGDSSSQHQQQRPAPPRSAGSDASTTTEKRATDAEAAIEGVAPLTAHSGISIRV
jgi:hypothetical protein